MNNDKTKYYWQKLDKDFFNSYKIRSLMASKNGDSCIVILLQLMNESLNYDGILRYSQSRAYTLPELASVINRTPKQLGDALKMLQEAELLKVEDDGTIVMDVDVGYETGSARRMREYRTKSEQNCDNVTKMSQRNSLQCHTEFRDKRLENRDKSIELDKDIEVISKETNLPYKEIIDYLNLTVGTNYKASSKKTKDLIKARFNEGFTIDDFKVVIDKKTMEWINDNKMKGYLRPETLFGTKFESYLNQPVKELTTKDITPYTDFSDFYTN